jgi:peptidoglycan/xylan/chitin deacetylase (PgdA/CDA1 family)
MTMAGVCSCWTMARTKVYIAKYKDNKPAAVSYTFDDGLLEQYTELFPVLKQLGLKASFCINGNTINRNERQLAQGGSDSLVIKKPRMTWAMIKEMSDQGQEISSHGWAHINVNKISGEALRYEVQHNDTVIFQHTGVFPRTFFYPGNAKSPEKIAFCSRDRVGTRTRQISIGSKRSPEWLHQWVRGLIKNGEWGIGMTHGISRGYDHFRNPQILFDHLADVAQLQDSIWVGTFHDVSAYVRERDSVNIFVKEKRHAIIVKPETRLDLHIFDYPLTLVVETPVDEARYKDGTSAIVSIDGNRSLINFLPAKGTLTIKKKSSK